MIEWRDWTKIVFMLESGCSPEELRAYVRGTTCRVCHSCESRPTGFCECPLSFDCGHGGYNQDVKDFWKGKGDRGTAVSAARVIRDILESSTVDD